MQTSPTKKIVTVIASILVLVVLLLVFTRSLEHHEGQHQAGGPEVSW